MPKPLRARPPRLHPVVDAYVNGRQDLSVILAAQPEPREPVVEALSAVMEAISGRGSMEQALRIAGATSLAGGDPQLVILFLCGWSILAYLTRRLPLLAVLGRQVKSLMSEDCPPTIRVLALDREGIGAVAEGNFVKREKLLRECLELVKPGDRLYRHILNNYSLYLAQFGRLPEHPEVLDQLERSGAGEEVTLARFIQHKESGHYQAALELLPEIEKNPKLVRSLDLPFYQMMLRLWRDRWSRPFPEGPLPAGLPDWAVSTDELLSRRPGPALAAVRPKADDIAEKFIIEKGFDSYSLIRAELASGHGEAARRLLEMRRARGNVYMLDDFFLARAALLAGGFEAAAGHFAAVAAACDRYDCRPALDFELRLACELAPGDLARLVQAAASAPKAAATGPAPAAATADPRGLGRLVGGSAALERIREQVRQIAGLDAPVLITGETGAGKELVARAVHESGPRAGEPFVAVNCGAITEALLESELFGHERGAFTGATRRHAGLFEEAGRGTILLDEVGDMPARLQAALLRVLEAGEIRAVGSDRSRKAACRILAATNADLDVLAGKGAFRQDLLFRLRRMEVKVPPLRERPEDILPLAGHFLAADRGDGRQPEMSAELQAAFLRHGWPGNVRELKNAIERLRLMNSDGLSYGLDSLGVEALFQRGAEPPAAPPPPAPDAGAEAAAEGPGRAPAPPTPRELDRLIAEGRSALRRLDRLRAFFMRYGKLTRVEAAAALGVCTRTATRDLRKLCAENFIEKVRPTASPRTHYFTRSGLGLVRLEPAEVPAEVPAVGLGKVFDVSKVVVPGAELPPLPELPEPNRQGDNKSSDGLNRQDAKDAKDAKNNNNAGPAADSVNSADEGEKP